MPYFNRTGAEFYTAPDTGVDFDSRRAVEAAPGVAEGLYFRRHEFPGLSELVDDCLTGTRDFSELSLDADQAWNESGWKKPQASIEAAIRFTDKAREEWRELDDAFEEYWDTRDATHFVEELGDFKWLMTAIASNSGVVANDAVKARLYEYIAGTRELKEDSSFGYPDWYDAAAAIAVKREPVTMGELDGLIEAGFAPRFSPAMNLYEEEEVSPTGVLFEFQGHIAFLRGLSERIFEHDLRAYQGIALYDVTQDVGKIVAEAYLKIAAMAHYAGATMTQVVRGNMEKINKRIVARTIDKEDGERE
jgi:hypothetical protein